MKPQRRPGVYVLLLASRVDACIPVGRLGRLVLVPGWYLYTGSARGPGGVAARLRHHVRGAARPHWHIDYLRAHLPLSECWYSHDPDQTEHRWATAVARQPGAVVALPRFGASDCRCETHLYHLPRKPHAGTFLRCLQEESRRPELHRWWIPEHLDDPR